MRYCGVIGWIALATVTACGGGGSSGSKPIALGWVQGQFAPRSSFATMCATPRTGVDPTTNKAYLDRQGTALDEKNWLRSWTNDLYLWYSEVPDQDPANFTSGTADLDYFKVLKTPASRTTSGGIVIPKDKFHFHYTTARWEALSQSGVSAGYGATFAFIANRPPRNLIVAYTEPNSPATLAPASLARGAQILNVDGVDLVNATDQASIDTLNAGISPATVGETHVFSILDAGASTARTVTLVSAQIALQPVRNVQVIQTSTGPVGYMQFNDH